MKKIIKGAWITMTLLVIITNTSCSDDKLMSNSNNIEIVQHLQPNKTEQKSDNNSDDMEKLLKLRLEDFNFLKLGITISKVEKVVGKAHFQTGSGFLKDAYKLLDGSYIELNYGPGLDELRSAKVIYKDGTVKNITLK